MSNNNTKKKNAPKRSKAAQRRRDTMQAYGVICAILIFIIGVAVYALFFRDNIKTSDTEPVDVPNNTVTVPNGSSPDSAVSVPDQSSVYDPGKSSAADPSSADAPESAADISTPDDDDGEPPRMDKDKHRLDVIDGRTYVDGILIVNKTYSLPSDYAPGILPEAQEAFDRMANASWGSGIGLFICSGFRSYAEQRDLYDGYAIERGKEAADRVSSRAGHSEHQSGLCMDVNTTEFEFEGTPEAIWLQDHCAEYGFIIRFPKGKEDITGYAYEPWHIRYVGEEAAKAIMDSGICLEEYLGVTSDYRYSKDQNDG